MNINAHSSARSTVKYPRYMYLEALRLSKQKSGHTLDRIRPLLLSMFFSTLKNFNVLLYMSLVRSLYSFGLPNAFVIKSAILCTNRGVSLFSVLNLSCMTRPGESLAIRILSVGKSVSCSPYVIPDASLTIPSAK